MLEKTTEEINDFKVSIETTDYIYPFPRSRSPLSKHYLTQLKKVPLE